jgi:flagellar biosynthesis GTPase FlhF
MSANAWWMMVVAALVIGAAAGGWATLRVTRSRFKLRLRHVTEELQQRHAATAEQLRTAQARAQTELEQSRSSFKRQLATLAAEPHAALQRAEDRLKAAYAELDRLRGKAAADTGSAELGDGFAATRPMRDGM